MLEASQALVQMIEVPSAVLTANSSPFLQSKTSNSERVCGQTDIALRSPKTFRRSI